jgi:hypothetical protein
MQSCLLYFALFALFNGLTFAQDRTSPGIKRPRTPDDYQSRTLKAISSMTQEESDLRDMQGTLVATKNILPSKVVAGYAGSSRPIETTKKELIHRKVDTNNSPAEVRFVDLRFAKPPLAFLTFDVRLRNYSGSSRWFLVPSNLGPGQEAIGGRGGVDALEAFLLLRKGRVTLGRFLGTGGFNALLLPAHADIRLRRFSISYWGELPESVSIVIVIAQSLTIGSESAERWFESSPLSSKDADILTDADRAMRLGKTKRTPDNKEIAPVIDVARRVELQVSLKRR